MGNRKKINRNYYIEIGQQKPAILVNEKCPHCESELGAIHPDRVWCTNEECSYARLHIVGEGTRGLKFKEPKKFYRVSDIKTNQGLWYDMDGNFTGLIHSKFNFCKNNSLQMPFDQRLVGWLSATDSITDLFNWFSAEDIQKLEPHGYRICEYETMEFKQHENHMVINQESSVLIRCMTFNELLLQLTLKNY